LLFKDYQHNTAVFSYLRGTQRSQILLRGPQWYNKWEETEVARREIPIRY